MSSKLFVHNAKDNARFNNQPEIFKFQSQNSALNSTSVSIPSFHPALLQVQGCFDPQKVQAILKLTETLLQQNEQNVPLKNKIFYIAMEILQNLSANNKGMPAAASGFSISRVKQQYEIRSQNFISPAQHQRLKRTLQHLKQLETPALKTLHSAQLRRPLLPEQERAGLGLLEIARISKRNFSYSFTKQGKGIKFDYCVTLK